MKNGVFTQSSLYSDILISNFDNSSYLIRLMKARKHLTKKILQYSAMAAGFLAAYTEGKSQVIYTDFDPDLSWEWGDDITIDLDIDSNGTIDFHLFTHTYFTSFYSGFGEGAELFIQAYSGNEVARFLMPVPTPSYFDAAYSIDMDSLFYNQSYAVERIHDASMVGASLNWGDANIVLAGACCFPGDGIWGKFVNDNLNDYYIGVKIYNPEPHYGWIRLINTDDASGQVIKAMAYQATPDTPLLATDFIANPATDVFLFDDGCSGTPADLHVSFTKAEDEITVSEYRIFAVTSDEAETFTEEDALAIDPAYYISLPTGSDISMYLPPTFKKWNGDEMSPLTEWEIGVLSVNNLPYTVDSKLVFSNPSTYYMGLAPVVDDLVLIKDGYTGTSADFRVQAEADDLVWVSEYRIMFVKNSLADEFGFLDAESALAANYISMPSTGVDLDVIVPAGFTTWDGELMQLDTLYKTVVLSVHNEPYSCGDGISLFSPGTSFFTLTTDAATSPELNFISAAGNSSDLHVQFTKANDEFPISEYRVMMVKEDEMASFTLDDAWFATPPNYISVIPAGEDVFVDLPPSFTTWNGELMTPLTSYVAFIVSVHLEPYTLYDHLSDHSNASQFTIYADGVGGISFTDAGSSGTSADLHVDFLKADDESGVSEYRVMVTTSEDAAFFDLTDANTVMPDHYVSVIPNEENISVNLPANFNTWEGELLQPDVFYKAFVLSVAKEPVSYTNTLSGPSLQRDYDSTDVTGIVDEEIDCNIFYSNHFIHVQFPDMIVSHIQVFDINGKKIYEGNFNQQHISIPVHMPPGIYFVKVNCSKGDLIGKIIVD